MFPKNTTKKSKKPSTFVQNHEPTSPKVTCIGQVRGKKSKKHPTNNLNILSHTTTNNHTWPFTISHTFKCFPCKSSCFSNNNNNNSNSTKNSNNNNSTKNSNSAKNSNDNNNSSGVLCGVVFRWMVSVHEENDVELIVGEDERGSSVVMERTCSRRKSIFDDMEFDDLFTSVTNNNNNVVGCNGNGNGNDNDNDNDGDKCGRVSICVPPKNALLLMRCRSNPMKMASISQNKCIVVDDEEEKVVIKEGNYVEIDEKLEIREVIKEVNEVEVEGLEVFREKVEVKLEEDKVGEKLEVKIDENDEKCLTKVNVLENVENTQFVKSEENNDEGKKFEEKLIEMMVNLENSDDLTSNDASIVGCKSLEKSNEFESNNENEEKDDVEVRKSIEKEKNDPMLPNCLLLMMYEPKLSMEVSKETWVCGTDFSRWLPERHPNQKLKKIEGESGNSHKKTKAAAVAALPPSGRSGIQPGRSSISFPTVSESVASLIGEKLGNVGVGYDPFVLTRCKSAPLRSEARFVSPELGCL